MTNAPRRAIVDDPDPAASPPTDAPQPPDGMEWLRSLGWRQFEQLVARAYRLQGYEVMDTASGADGGIDLILFRGPERIFVQCKAWNAWQVGVHQVREFFGVMVAGRATGGIFVTSGRFSQDAVLFAQQVGLRLVNGPELLSLLAAGTPGGGSPEVGSPPPPWPSLPTSPHSSAGTPTCPACLAPMVVRRARRGPRAGASFWGCSRYPSCKMVLDRPAPSTRQGVAGSATYRGAAPDGSRPRKGTGRRMVLLVLLLACLAAVVFLLGSLPTLILHGIRAGLVGHP